MAIISFPMLNPPKRVTGGGGAEHVNQDETFIPLTILY